MSSSMTPTPASTASSSTQQYSFPLPKHDPAASQDPDLLIVPESFTDVGYNTRRTYLSLHRRSRGKIVTASWRKIRKWALDTYAEPSGVEGFRPNMNDEDGKPQKASSILDSNLVNEVVFSNWEESLVTELMKATDASVETAAGLPFTPRVANKHDAMELIARWKEGDPMCVVNSKAICVERSLENWKVAFMRSPVYSHDKYSLQESL